MEFIWKAELSEFDKNIDFVAELHQVFFAQGFSATHSDILVERFTAEQPDICEVRDWFTWTYKLFHALRTDKLIQLELNDQFVIDDITTRFTRYEKKRFLLFHIRLKDEPKDADVLGLQRQLKHQLALYNKATGLNLKDDFRVTTKFVEYKEVVQIMNPIPLIEGDIPQHLQLELPNQHDAPLYTRLYGKSYLTREKDAFIREHRTVYRLKQPLEADAVADDSTDIKRSMMYDRVHTEILFFIRGENIEEELSPDYEQIKFLEQMTGVLSSKWAKVRAVYSLKRKFTTLTRSHTSRLVFRLLEVSAHLSSLLTRVKFHFADYEAKFSERLERPLFTIEKDGSAEEMAYFNDLRDLAFSSYKVYQRKLEHAEEGIARIDENIQKLHDDFDSKTNLVLQGVLFLFSIIFISWGVYEIWLDKVFLPLEGSVLQSVVEMVGYSGIMIGALMLIFWLLSLTIVNITSLGLKRKTKKLIRKWLERSDECEDCLDEFKDLIANASSSKTENERVLYELEVYILALMGVSLGLVKPDVVSGFVASTVDASQ